MRIAGLLLALLMVSVSAANAQILESVQGAITNASLVNETNASPVWVTIYTAKLGSLGPWKIVKADCVEMHSTGGWTFPAAPYVKVRAEAKGGHALCNTKTYWDGSISTTAMNGDYGQNVSVKLDSLPGGGTKLSYY